LETPIFEELRSEGPILVAPIFEGPIFVEPIFDGLRGAELLVVPANGEYCVSAGFPFAGAVLSKEGLAGPLKPSPFDAPGPDCGALFTNDI